MMQAESGDRRGTAATLQDRISRFSSIVRVPDPSQPAERAVLIALPVAALAAAAWSLAGDSPGLWVALQRGGVMLLGTCGAWAVARELLPDDRAGALVSFALAFFACLAVAEPGLVTLFATLGLVRIVNRSSGLAARMPDSVVVAALVVWAVYATASPWFAAVGALAFLLDATLRRPLQRHLLFMLVCGVAMVVYIVDHDVAWLEAAPPARLPEWLAVIALVVFSLHLLLLRRVEAHGDAGGERLDVERVKGGMAIATLASLQGLDHLPDVVLLVASVGGLCIGIAFRRAFRASGSGPPAT